MLSRLSVKRWLVLAVAFSAAGAPMCSQAQKNLHKRDVRAEVERVDRQWHDAELANDTTAMEKLLADDYLGVMASGHLITRAQQLQRMYTRQMEIRQLQFSDVKVKLLGGNAAIVTSLVQLDATMDGRAMQGMYRATRTYQRVPGTGWKLVYFNATRVRGEDAGGAPGH
jgi:ketosteroid isomerase-like protein